MSKLNDGTRVSVLHPADDVVWVRGETGVVVAATTVDYRGMQFTAYLIEYDSTGFVEWFDETCVESVDGVPGGST